MAACFQRHAEGKLPLAEVRRVVGQVPAAEIDSDLIGIEDFDTNPIGMIRDSILGVCGEDKERPGRAFKENGMRIYDLEVLNVTIGDKRIADLLWWNNWFVYLMSISLYFIALNTCD